MAKQGKVWDSWKTSCPVGTWSFLCYPAGSETLRAGIHTWKAPWTKSCPAAPCRAHRDKWPRGIPAAAVPLMATAPALIPLISITYISLSHSTNCFNQHLPTVSVQSVSLFSSNNVKWQIPWRTLSHLYLEGIFFTLLRPECLDLISIKTEPRCLDRKYSLFQTKLIFWIVFTPKVRTGSRNDLCLGHIGQYYSGGNWKS